MKNVSHDYELENDTTESVEDQQPLPQFRQQNEAKKRRVEYDKHGNVRKDNSNRWLKLAGLIAVVILVNLYVFHTCGAQLFGIK